MKSSTLILGAVLGIAAACQGSSPPRARGSSPSAPAAEGGAGTLEPAANGAAGTTPDEPQSGAGSERGGAGPELPSPPLGGASEGGDANAAPIYGPFEGPARCTSGMVRDPNASEGPEMNPGFPCITCHLAASEGDAPVFAFAGTLYPSVHEPNSCQGAAANGAEVVISDAMGLELRAEANTSGNFLLEDALLTPPFSAKVLFDGRERATTTAHDSGDCNVCHTQQGDQGAPGRIVLP